MNLEHEPIWVQKSFIIDLRQVASGPGPIGRAYKGVNSIVLFWIFLVEDLDIM